MLRNILIILFLAATFIGCTPAKSNSTNNNTTTSSAQANMSDKADKYDKAPAKLSADELKDRTAVIKTSKGEIKIKLNGAKAPFHVSNFIFLAKENFYDGLTFHRREENFVIQGGDPLGTGTGGPGYTVPSEVDNGLKHTKGALAMARQADYVNPKKASSGSQFYITLAPANFLDEEYSVFGYVADDASMDVVSKIQVGDTIIDITVN
jgi:cyclophilin family peptidyl-prolyl cis-trans isomerase